MKLRRRPLLIGTIAVLLVAGAGQWWSQHRVFHYLTGETDDFLTLVVAPSSRESPQTRAELDELLELQRTRTAAEVAAAQADRKKDVSRFYTALGFGADAPPLPRLQALTDAVEADIGPYVRVLKEKYRRLRPYEIEPRLEPCIGDVKGDLSYPSGHATYGYVMAFVLSDMVPERRVALEARADEYARQRMVCGVHFRSDLDAGKVVAGTLASIIDRQPAYRQDANAAMVEVRAALNLPTRPPRPL